MTSNLANLVDDAIGGLWGKPPDSQEADHTDVLVVRGADFRRWDERRAKDAAPRMIPERFLERRRLRPGDLVLEVSGGGPGQPVGRVVLIDENAVADAPKPLICSNFCRKLRLKDHVDPAFVKRQLDWHYRSGKTEAFQTSSTNIRNLQVDEFLEGTEVALPEPGEQKKLSSFLESVDASGSSCLQHVVAAEEALGHLRPALASAACRGELTAEWREANSPPPVDPSPELSAAGQKNASGSANTDELIDIPDGWEWWPLEAAAEQVIDYRGRTPPSETKGPIPHIRTTQIRKGEVDWGGADRFVTRDVYKEYMTRGIPQKGDVLFTMEAPLGEVGLVDRDEPFSVAQRILLIRPNSLLDGRLLGLVLQSGPVRQAIENRATGSGVRGIAYKRLRSVVVPIPPLPEQKEILRQEQRLRKVSAKLASRIQTTRTQVVNTPNAVLAHAFSTA